MSEHFDVFLSHNSHDKAAVIALAKQLKAQGLKVWLDVWELRPGQPWQEALEHIIETTQAAVVAVGKDGLGPWQNREMRGCLSEFAENDRPVIPVLLPDCPAAPKLPFFLRQLTWVDLRDGKEAEGFLRLLWGITGEKPKELDEDSLIVPALQRGNADIDAPASSAPTAQDRPDKDRSSGQDGVPTQEAGEHDAKNAVIPAGIAGIQSPRTVASRPQQPIPNIHGWPAAQVQALQRETAQSLGRAVRFRDTLQAGGEGPLMAVVPAGAFVMGSPADEPGRSNDEGPQHSVTFARPFAVGVYAVTFDDYDYYCKAAGKPKVGDAGWGRGRRPVINVSWDDAVAYCTWLSAQTGQSYRLPSEAEWEYACRAGTDTPFYFGTSITPSLANYDGGYTYNGGSKGEYRKQTVPVEEFPPNAFGLYQMHGNVWEWCEDRWHDDYKSAPEDGSAWVVGGNADRRAVRGGSWDYVPQGLRSGYRDGSNEAFNYLGFRLARAL